MFWNYEFEREVLIFYFMEMSFGNLRRAKNNLLYVKQQVTPTSQPKIDPSVLGPSKGPGGIAPWLRDPNYKPPKSNIHDRLTGKAPIAYIPKKWKK